MWVDDIWIDDEVFTSAKLKPVFTRKIYGVPALKLKARNDIRRAVREGRIEKLPCEECGVSGEVVHAHHDDYSKPLSVTWLCRKHHQLLHKRIGFYEIKYIPD